MKKITAALMVGLTLSLGLPALAAEQPSQNQTPEQPKTSMTLPKDLLVPEFWGVDLPGDKKIFSIHQIVETNDRDIQIQYANYDSTEDPDMRIFSLAKNKVVHEIVNIRDKVEREKKKDNYYNYISKNKKKSYESIDKIKLENGLTIKDVGSGTKCYGYDASLAFVREDNTILEEKLLVYFPKKSFVREARCSPEGIWVTVFPKVYGKTIFSKFYLLGDGTYLISDWEGRTIVRFYGMLQSPYLDDPGNSHVLIDPEPLQSLYHEAYIAASNSTDTEEYALEKADSVVQIFLQWYVNQKRIGKLKP